MPKLTIAQWQKAQAETAKVLNETPFEQVSFREGILENKNKMFVGMRGGVLVRYKKPKKWLGWEIAILMEQYFEVESLKELKRFFKHRSYESMRNQIRKLVKAGELPKRNFHQLYLANRWRKPL